MRYAKVNDELKEATYLAHRDNSCTCPGCGSPVIAKICVDRVDHWAHHNVDNCDTWYEPITDWHIKWQDKFPKENREVHIVKDGKRHISDVHINRFFIEFQNSVIPYGDVGARGKFYGSNLVWVLNGNGPICNGVKLITKAIIKYPRFPGHEVTALLKEQGFLYSKGGMYWYQSFNEKFPDSLPYAVDQVEYKSFRCHALSTPEITYRHFAKTKSQRGVFDKMDRCLIDLGNGYLVNNKMGTYLTYDDFVSYCTSFNWEKEDEKERVRIEQDRQRRALETKILRRRMDNNRGLFLP